MVVPAPTTLKSGRARAGRTAARRQRRPLDAVFCSSDLLALGVMTEAQARGVAVPGQLAVVGFGDLEFAADLHPALTTVHINGTAIGRQAAQFIVDRAEGRASGESRRRHRFFHRRARQQLSLRRAASGSPRGTKSCGTHSIALPSGSQFGSATEAGHRRPARASPPAPTPGDNPMKTLICALALAAASLAQAQTWPSKPVTLLVPFPPGGSTDMIARTLAPKLQEKLGGTFIIENKAGATGTIGAGHRQARAGRRLHDLRLVARAVRHRAAPDQERALRRAEGLRPHHRGRAGAQRAGGAGRVAAQVAGRRDRLPQGQPGQDELRLVGQRLAATT